MLDIQIHLGAFQLLHEVCLLPDALLDRLLELDLLLVEPVAVLHLGRLLAYKVVVLGEALAEPLLLTLNCVRPFGVRNQKRKMD